MSNFKGFSEQERFIPIPDAFFRHLLGEITDVDELRVTLFALWRVAQMEGQAHFLQVKDFKPLVADPAAALEKAVQRGSLLLARPEGPGESLVFLNTPRGRAAAQGYAGGKWKPQAGSQAAPAEKPNIFKLYEENIGPLTPLVADMLREAEETYAAERIEEAVRIAVRMNKRNWKYVEAILRRWKEEGYAKEQDRRDDKELSSRDIKREIDEFFKR